MPRPRRAPGRPAAPPPQEDALRKRLGRKLRALRIRRYGRPVTLGEIARTAGISVSYLSMIERGARSAPVETLFELALALGVPLSELFRLEDGPSAPDPAFAELTAFAAERRLGRRELARLLVVARALLGS